MREARNIPAEPEPLRPPVFVGRITLGASLIAMGLFTTAGLLVPQLELFRLARLAPLVLVLLGAEILWAAHRHKGQPVKVGLGLTLLCLVLIFGSVGAALLGEAYGLACLPVRPEQQTVLMTQERLDRLCAQSWQAGYDRAVQELEP